MRRLLIPVLGSLLAGALIAAAQAATHPPAPARAAAATPGEFLASSQSAVFDPATGQVTFTLTFNRPPDRQTGESFQYFIVGDPSLHYPNNYDTIIRGEEPTEDVLQVRNSHPNRSSGTSRCPPRAGGAG